MATANRMLAKCALLQARELSAERNGRVESWGAGRGGLEADDHVAKRCFGVVLGQADQGSICGHPLPLCVLNGRRRTSSSALSRSSSLAPLCTARFRSCDWLLQQLQLCHECGRAVCMEVDD